MAQQTRQGLSKYNKANRLEHSSGEEQSPEDAKTILLLLTLSFGWLGAHKFYLDKKLEGVVYLLIFWTGIPFIISLLEICVYRFTSPENLVAKYNFRGDIALSIVNIVVLIVILSYAISIIGIIAAVVIPNFIAYKNL